MRTRNRVFADKLGFTVDLRRLLTITNRDAKFTYCFAGAEYKSLERSTNIALRWSARFKNREYALPTRSCYAQSCLFSSVVGASNERA